MQSAIRVAKATMERPEKELTDRQVEVLEYIILHIQTTGFPPTIREIGERLSIKSTNGVNDHLKALERKGYLSREDTKSRAIRPVFAPDGSPMQSTDDVRILEDVHSIPIVGRIAAGEPISAIENAEDHVSIGQGLLGKAQGVFGLVVSGESMIEDGIFDGDYIFIKPQNDARNGEIVAVMVDEEATVKRFYRESGRIRLQPANATMEPIYIDASQWKHTVVLGKVVGVFRRLH
jgi:repressor LexA